MLKQLLNYFTFFEEEKINDVVKEDENDRTARKGKKILANEVIRLITGDAKINNSQNQYQEYFKININELAS